MPASYIASPILKIDGQKASQALIDDILQIAVEESLHLPSTFTLIINNPLFPGLAADQIWKHQNLFKMGGKISIGFASSTTSDADFDAAASATIFEGEITAIEAHFSETSQAPIIIRGYDVSHRLHRGRYNRSFQNVTDTDIVNQIIAEAGISAGTVESSGSPHDYVFQENQTNMEFLRERAARNGFELFVQDGKLNFRKPSSSTTLKLQWLKDFSSFSVRVSGADQVSEVEVRGWDYTKKEAIVSKKTSANLLTSNQFGKGTESSTAFSGSPKMTVVGQPVFSTSEADKIAQSLLDELSGEYVVADARAEGNPKIRPGKLVELSAMGKYSGKYYITETRHVFSDRIYRTEFCVRGLRSGDLLSILSASSPPQAGQTLMVGIVSNNNDPKKWGRVRVKFPTLTEEHESNWARVVTFGAGPDRGNDWLPEVNDEVLVGFEHGDIHRPYVIGSVWNGTDAPPTVVTDSVVDGKVRLRTMKTRTGHTLQFIEEDKGASKKGFQIKTVYGHQITLNDTEKFTEIKTTNNHYVKMDDQNKKLEIKTQGGHTILLDDNGSAKVDLTSTGDINVKSGTSGTSKKISISGGEIELTGTTKITLKVGANKIEISNSGITIDGTLATVKAKGQAKLEGALVNVEASGITVVKGSLLKLN